MRGGAAIINRPQVHGGPEHYKTYSARAPVHTHWRKATCEEFECDMWMFGGVLTVDLSTEIGQQQYHYVTKVDRERSYSMQRLDQDIVKFIYGPGTPCFEPIRSTHMAPIGRPPFYLVIDGDWRGNPRRTPTYHHRRPEEWVEDFATHQDRIARAIQKG